MREVEEAEAWLEGAEHLLLRGGKDRPWFTVSVAMAIHGMIRANDALTVRHLGRASSRHEDAALLFRQLLVQGSIPAVHAGLRALLVRAAASKSDYDYQGTEVGRRDAERWVRDASRFLTAVREILGVEVN